MMRSCLIGLLAALALLAFAAEAVAANSHFARATATGPDGAGNLTVNFTIAGLGRTQATVTASADATAIVACRDEQGNETVIGDAQEPVSASGQFGSGAGTLTLSPPPLPPLEQNPCQLGQWLAISSVSFTNVGVSEPNAGALSIPGTF